MTDIVERLRTNQPLPICPFDKKSPEYWTTPDNEQCKFCGGLPDGPDKCTGADTRVLGEAADLIESLRSRAEKAEAERDEARDTNRKLHRRLQIAEAVQQSAEDYLGSWLQIFTPSRNDRRGERHFIMYILRDAKMHVAKLSERYSAAYRKEAEDANG